MWSLHRLLWILILILGANISQVLAENYSIPPVDHDALEAWQDYKLGLIIHWGPVSIAGTDISWSRAALRPGRTGQDKKVVTQQGKRYINKEIYDSLYREFNPTEFDAEEWVKIFKEAGVKYIVFITKHHDGFSMFDTAYSDYKITAPDCPYGKDITAQLSDACHKSGISFGVYYSVWDWYHPDNLTVHHDRYIDFMFKQVRELCTNYGKVDMMWFDGVVDPVEWKIGELATMARKLQPHILINNRGGLKGDFTTPEQRIGAYQPDKPWETVITFYSQMQWSWLPEGNVRSLKECIQTLVRCIGGGGNILYGVAPMPSGSFDLHSVKRLREMGAWLRENGESIYGTRGGPIPPQSWGVTSQKENTIYLHVLNESDDYISVPPLDRTVKSAKILNGPAVQFTSSELETIVKLPSTDRDPYDTVIKIELE